MPPARTGVADYSVALMRAMAAIKNRPQVDNLPYIYHVGNNALHREIYARALQEPGVVVLHDAVLHHFFLGSLNQRQYIEEFTYNYGAWQDGVAQTLWNQRARSASDPRYFRYPMLRRIAERSTAVIVHNPAAANTVRAHAPNAKIHEIPHLFVEPGLPPGYEIERLRARLGLERKFLFGVFGHLRESKRLNTILRAFDSVRRVTDAALVVAGEFASSDLERAVNPLLHDLNIIRTGYLAEREFWLYASAVDACINLRYPPAGETSGIAIRLMGIGKPVLLSGGPEVLRYPEAACVKLDPGSGEQEALEAVMLWLAKSPSDARDIGRRAREYIRHHHAGERVAAMYWSVLEQAPALI